MTTSNTIVAFHIGRGGRFNNQGHRSFIGQKTITECFGDKWIFDHYENQADIKEAIGERENLLKKYDECCDKDDFTFFEKLGFDLGEKAYFDFNGNPVGLTVAEGETGIGRLELDGDYDTTYTCYIENCDRSELLDILETRSERGYTCSDDIYEMVEDLLVAMGEGVFNVTVNGDLLEDGFTREEAKNVVKQSPGVDCEIEFNYL